MEWTYTDHEEGAYRGISNFKQSGYLVVIKLERQSQEQFDEQCKEMYKKKKGQFYQMDLIGCADVVISKNDFLDLCE